MRFAAVLVLALLSLAGCQNKTASPSSYAYPYPARQGPSVDDEIRFYKDRVDKRPRSFLERNNLAAAYLTKAQSRSDPGYFELAERLARESLKLMPTHNGGATLILASVAEARHDFKSALKLAGEVYNQDPSNLEAQALLSNSYLETGEIALAAPGAELMVARAPTSGSLNFRARVLMAQGHDAEAERHLLEAVRREQPQEHKVSARSRSLLGELYLRQGKLAQAQAALEAARAIDPTNSFTLTDLGRLAERQGQATRAADYYAAGYDGSRNPALLVELARLKRDQGQSAEAEKLWAQAEAKLKPELEAGGYGHSRDLARLWLDRNQPGEAEKARALMEKELARRHDVRTRELLAEACGRTGQLDRASQVLAQAVATGWSDPVLLARLAQLEERRGQAQVAQELWKRARAIDPQVGPSPWP